MRLMISLIILTLFSITALAQQKTLNLIPYPVEVTQQPGTYFMKDKITVSNSFPAHDWKGLFNYFRDELKKQFGITVTETVKGTRGDIDFFMKRMPTSGKPAYQLDVSKDGISINTNFSEPAFHAIQTLFQLLPVDIKEKKEIPFVAIFDYARFDYRGIHLDVGRHFFPISFIKKYIDYLAYHKLNTFHWHLTEDQGWRIEIKKYPKLTSVGGWRNGTIIGRYPGTGNDNIRYSGFYTQAEIKQVVKYAQERFIQVIPEIEMPGHSSAAIAAYPWLSCFPGKPTAIPANMISTKSIEEQKKGRTKLVQETWGVFDDVFCAGNDSTFIFLQNVIDEVITLFPSKYFHIGADECPKTHWKVCPKCQLRMKENNLKDEHELQSWFVQRIEKYLNSKGKTLIGWDEILEGGLAPNAVVMSWRGEQGGIDAAKQNHDVIMTPGNPVYFDHTQSENEDSVTIGGYNPIEKVYAYEPVPKELIDEHAKHVLGAQANMWTEYMKNTNKVEYMLFPRIAALSEVLWSQKEKKSWSDFEKRLMTQFKRYDFWKVNYSRAFFDLKATIIPSENNKGVLWKLESKNKDTWINYNKTLDVTDPPNPPAFQTYISPVEIYKSGEYSGWSMENGRHMENTITQKFLLNKASGKKITLEKQASKNYPGDGPFTLVNGVQNEKGMSKTKEFLGFSGDDCIATIDLGKVTDLNEITVHFLVQTTSWIYPPDSVLFKLFDENMQKTGGAKVAFDKEELFDEKEIKIPVPGKARYVQVIIKNYGIIPSGNPGAGSKAWLFVDEIEVN